MALAKLKIEVVDPLNLGRSDEQHEGNSYDILTQLHDNQRQSLILDKLKRTKPMLNRILSLHSII